MRRFRNFFQNRIGAVIFFTGWFAVAANAPGLQAKRAEIGILPDKTYSARAERIEKEVNRLKPIRDKYIVSKDRPLIARTKSLIKKLYSKGRYRELDDLSQQYFYIARLSRKGLLDGDRKRILFKQLSFNMRYFGNRHSPGHNYVTRVFPGSHLVWTYYSGRGWQIHPLSSLKRCGSFLREGNRNSFLSSLNEVLKVRARRGERQKFYANEYYFPWEGYRLPWISSMTEGLKLSLLSKALTIDSNAKRRLNYCMAIKDTLTSFKTDFRKGGVADGSWYLEYAFHNNEKVLNGFQFSLIGLSDFNSTMRAETKFDPVKYRRWRIESKRLFDRGVRELCDKLHLYDLGSWSRYSLIESPAIPSYHRIHVSSLRRLAAATSDRGAKRMFLEYADRWGGKAGLKW